jgi:hypothetical protein
MPTDTVYEYEPNFDPFSHTRSAEPSKVLHERMAKLEADYDAHNQTILHIIDPLEIVMHVSAMQCLCREILTIEDELELRMVDREEAN